MSQRRKRRYAFADVPVDPVDPGTSLLVAGPSLGGARELLLKLLVGSDDEGTLIVAADVTAAEAIENFERAGGVPDPDRVRVVDCSQEGGADRDGIVGVGTPGDLTGIGIAFSNCYEQLYAGGVERVRTGMYTLGPLLVFADDTRPVFRFLHTVTGRVQSADGLYACAVDPAAHDERTLQSIAQTFDGKIELREEAGTHQVRVRGLADQPEGWHAFEPHG